MKNLEDKIIKTPRKLNQVISAWKTKNQKVVFTNGCFDILHFGHLKLLFESKKLGDKLIVGLNTDISIKKIKGEHRPLNTNYQRSIMLASLSFVDKIVFFSEMTPINLIKQISPNILTKGSDYKLSNVVGLEEILNFGGEVKLIPIVENLSTSLLIRENK